MALSAFYGTIPPDEERLKLLDAVYEHGVTLWDTADTYGGNEELLGKWSVRVSHCSVRVRLLTD